MARSKALSVMSLLSRGADKSFIRCLYCHYVFDDQVAEFDRIIGRLRSLGTFVDTAALLAMLSGDRPLDHRYFHLSFDAGVRNDFTNRTIDDGDILLVEKWPIVFGRSLAETVRRNLEIGRTRAPSTMADVCRQYEELRQRAVEQHGGRSYTTPTFRQYLRMLRNHDRMRAEAATRAA